MLPHFVDLQILRKFGFEKTKEYSPEYKEYIDVWVKKPEIKKRKNKTKKGRVRKK